MRFATRVFLTLLVIAVVFGMGIHYDIASDRHWPYPGSDDLAADYDVYVGEQILLFGTVLTVDEPNNRAHIEIEYTYGSFTMTVHDFTADVTPSGTVQIWGTLQADRSVIADNVVVVNRSGGAELLKFALSGLGALTVLVAFFRRWRIDWDTMAFEDR